MRRIRLGYTNTDTACAAAAIRNGAEWQAFSDHPEGIKLLEARGIIRWNYIGSKLVINVIDGSALDYYANSYIPEGKYAPKAQQSAPAQNADVTLAHQLGGRVITSLR